MKKLLILAVLTLGVSMLASAQPTWQVKNALLKDYDGFLYLDGGEIQTATWYLPVYARAGGIFPGSTTIAIYKNGILERTLTNPQSFFLYHIIGEVFWYDVFVTATDNDGKTYTAQYRAYNSGKHLP